MRTIWTFTTTSTSGKVPKFAKYLHSISGDEVNAEYFKTSPKCQELVESDDSLKDFDDLQLYFFKKYMKIVTDAADFNIDGWEEVWEFERPGKVDTVGMQR